MSDCKNCYNGCTETISDKCIKYTGEDIIELGIEHGNTLLSVEQAIITYLTSVLTGDGITPSIDPAILCTIVQDNLPVCAQCTSFSLNDVLEAIIKSVCQLQAQIHTINTTLNILNADYDKKCLVGVNKFSDTHDIVQAVINNLCSLNSAFTVFVLSVQKNYINVTDIDSYISNYINTNTPDKALNKMVPFVPQAYYGAITNYPTALDNFDSTGAGQGYWSRVFICNGSNNTPDLRGRVLAGIVTGVPAVNALHNDVNPASNPLIPNYTSSNPTAGKNFTTLLTNQIPSHNHAGSTAVTTVTDPGHTHFIANGTDNTENRGLTGANSMNHYRRGDNASYFLQGSALTPDRGKTSSQIVTAPGITAITALTMQSIGGGLPHSNVQPSFGINWIMYIP